MSIYLPGQVYENLVKMMAYRGAVVTSPVLDANTVAQKLNLYDHVTIMATRGAADIRGKATLVTVLVAPGSAAGHKSADFKKLIKGLPKTANAGIEYIIVTENVLTTHVEKQVAALRRENPTIDIGTHEYKYWLTEAPKSVQGVPHSIATKDEVDHLCRTRYTDPSTFPIIRQGECQAVWIGAKPGMVVRIDRLSETAGEAVAYRLCLPGK